MKKLFPLALTLASLALVPSSAMAALDGYKVFIVNGGDKPVGSWDLSLDEETADAQIAGTAVPHTEACRYWVHWTNVFGDYAPELASFTWLRVDELQTQGHECEEIPDTPQHSLITLAYGTNKGFNQQQQKKSVNMLVVGEDGESGELNGMIQFNGSAMFGFEGDPEP